MNTTITSTNNVFTIVITDLFPVPVQLQNYASNKAFTTETLNLTKIQMDVNGHITTNFIPNPTKQTITLQTDNPNKNIFTTLIQTTKTTGEPNRRPGRFDHHRAAGLLPANP